MVPVLCLKVEQLHSCPEEGGWDVLEGRRAYAPFTLYPLITDYSFYFVSFYFVSPSQLLGLALVSAEHACLPVSL